MSRSARPTHIPLPTSPFINRSPNGSPVTTPSATNQGQALGSPTSPRASSFLPNFMRTRSRAATVTGRGRSAGSPTVEAGNPLTTTASREAGPRDGGGVTRSVSTPVTGGLSVAVPAVIENGEPPKTYRIRLVPHLESTRSLAFDPVVRELLPLVVPPGITPATAAAAVTAVGPLSNGKPPALLLKVGRFTDKSQPQQPPPAAGPSSLGIPPLTIAGGGGDVSSNKVAFKSKVVSRSHAEIWCEAGGKFYIRDTASSSGTFLNHIRLSSPNTESRPTMINDGDVLQLGVDYQGGLEDMFRCVKMRVELGREWQRGANEFNTNALKQLKALGGAPDKGKATETPSSAKKGRASVTDCCICLFSVTVCQALFIAPCSHVFHYKCIRPLLQQHHPGFSCPLCRTFANLEEDVETEDAWEIASRRASVISRRPSNHSIRIIPQELNGDGPDEASGTDPEMTGSSVLARQATAVQEEAAPRGDVDMPEALPEETDPNLAGSLAIVRNPAVLESFSEAQTPMNETFLSTLAPGMHQRLDLAEAMLNEVVHEDIEGEEAEAASSRAEGSSESESRREDIDMMFS